MLRFFFAGAGLFVHCNPSVQASLQTLSDFCVYIFQLNHQGKCNDNIAAVGHLFAQPADGEITAVRLPKLHLLPRFGVFQKGL